MSEFDVIVIGGGPSGCYAALSAATRGCSVAILEEHGSIGRPRHDTGWLMESRFARSVINAVGKAVPWSKVKEYRVCDPESGDLIETSAIGGYLVWRDLLEKEIAAKAIEAGVHLYLKTKVTKLTRSGTKVVGVETNSDAMPRANGKVFICADGIRSSSSGFAVEQGLCAQGEVRSGVMYVLANADVSAGVIEHFISSDPLLNYKCFFTQQNGVSFFLARSPKEFQELKERADNFVSMKIRNAYPMEVSGYAASSVGRVDYFERIVKDNLMFVGDASGGAGTLHGMIQGQFAGTVAASAIREKDISEGRLLEYQHLALSTLRKAPFCWGSARKDFGSFSNWLRIFEESTKGVEAAELAQLG